MTEKPDARSRYLEIAARHFAERGFHGVSLAALAGEAGVTKQALLHFFASKEKLYAEVLSELADRLSTSIDTIAAPTPEDRLIAYFTVRDKGALVRPDDARLVTRALLDTDPAARMWPLKPYLDKLVALARETRRWKEVEPEEIFAGLYQLIGALQYLHISEPTLQGMYGKPAQARMVRHFDRNIEVAVRHFALGH